MKKAIHANTENKVAVYKYTRSGVTATDNATAPLTFNLLPIITIGTGQVNRIGNEVRQMRTIFDVILARASTSGVAAAPELITVVIGRMIDNFDTPAFGDQNYMKISDSSAGTLTTAGIYSADMRTLQTPFNKDYWDIKYCKTYKLWNSSNATNLYWNNNDFKLFARARINITKMLKKHWKFQGAVNNFAQNDGLYAMFYVHNVDDNGTPTNAVFVDATLTCYFEDA